MLSPGVGDPPSSGGAGLIGGTGDGGHFGVSPAEGWRLNAVVFVSHAGGLTVGPSTFSRWGRFRWAEALACGKDLSHSSYSLTTNVSWR